MISRTLKYSSANVSGICINKGQTNTLSLINFGRLKIMSSPFHFLSNKTRKSSVISSTANPKLPTLTDQSDQRSLLDLSVLTKSIKKKELDPYSSNNP